MTLSTDPYKGVRDFYPADQRIQKYMFDVMRRVCERFGYEEYNASLLEPTDLYRAKSSQEIISEQTYSFKDRGDRDVTLRPEMTPTVARMVAAKRRELAFPLRWFSIPNVFRYENPQRGRLREHWQLNVDLFGSSSIEADIEVLSMAHGLLLAFGAKESDFEIRINNRKDMPNDPAALRLLDKKAKMSHDDFEREAQKISLNATALEGEETKKIISLLKEREIKNVVYSSDIVRGFDYYTGMVFEVFDTDAKNARSLFGGGRYDNLMDIFETEKIPAVGFGAGDVTLRDFLETHNLLPQQISSTQIMLCIICTGENKEKIMTGAERLASELREKGLNIALDFSDKKIGDQIKNADKRGVPYIIVIGESELQEQKFKVKKLATGDEHIFDSADAIAKFIQNL